MTLLQKQCEIEPTQMLTIFVVRNAEHKGCQLHAN